MKIDSNTSVEEVEQNEKSVAGCNHNQDNEEKRKQFIKTIGGVK